MGPMPCSGIESVNYSQIKLNNMQKKTLIYLVGIGALVIAAIVTMYWLIAGRSNNAGSSNPGNSANQTSGTDSGSAQIPSYTLSAQEEQNMAEFVNNFVSLYNSYSYQDLSNPLSLGDFETIRMQNETIQLTNQLDTQLKPGYEIRTSGDQSTFSYNYPSINNLFATISAHVKESQNATVTHSYDAVAQLELIRVSNLSWRVNSIEIRNE